MPALPPDGTTGKTTQFWLRAKAQAIIDSQSTKELLINKCNKKRSTYLAPIKATQ
jgi:hypothetical protein